VAAGHEQDAWQRKGRQIMRLLRRLRTWWREFWGSDTYWPAEVDSHQWDNKVEMFHRLSSQSD